MPGSEDIIDFPEEICETTFHSCPKNNEDLIKTPLQAVL